jgi:hypothetical protein
LFQKYHICNSDFLGHDNMIPELGLLSHNICTLLSFTIDEISELIHLLDFSIESHFVFFLLFHVRLFLIWSEFVPLLTNLFRNINYGIFAITL